MQKDPIRFDGRQANLYVYVNDDPINGSDPRGEAIDCAVCLAKGAAAWSSGLLCEVLGDEFGPAAGGICSSQMPGVDDCLSSCKDPNPFPTEPYPGFVPDPPPNSGVPPYPRPGPTCGPAPSGGCDPSTQSCPD
jgi:hypothetical protein